jgi:hypothetical protein
MISMDYLARLIFVANQEMVPYMDAQHGEEEFSFLALVWWCTIDQQF